MTKIVEDWQSLLEGAVPAGNNGKKSFEEEREYYNRPYRVGMDDDGKYLREDKYYTIRGHEGSRKLYAFVPIPDAKGRPFMALDIASVKLWRFHNPTKNEDVFMDCNLIMDPAKLFDLTVLDIPKDKRTAEQDKEAAQIERHASLVKRFKDLYYNKEVDFGYARGIKSKFSQRVRWNRSLCFFGVWTVWGDNKNTHGDRTVKFITIPYKAAQDKFRESFSAFANAHIEAGVTNFQELYLAPPAKGEIKALVTVRMGSMKVGGTGVDLSLAKVPNSDAVENFQLGYAKPITAEEIQYPTEDANKLDFLSYALYQDSTLPVWQDKEADLFEEAIEQLESHLEDVKAGKAEGIEPESATEATQAQQPAADATSGLPEGMTPEMLAQMAANLNKNK